MDGDDISGLVSTQRDSILNICYSDHHVFTNVFMLNVVVSCYSNAGVQFFDTQSKIGAMELT